MAPPNGDHVAGQPAVLLDQVHAFRYVTADNAPTYRAIMQVFSDATERYVIELRPADLLAGLREGGYVVDVDDARELEERFLGQLAAWGNLVAAHDHVGVERLADWYQRRLVYRLTDLGEAAHRAVAQVEATLGRSGSLQTNMLVKIRDALLALHQAAIRTDADPDAEELLRLLHDLHSAFDTLTREASRFMTDLGPLAADDRERASDDAFMAYKQAVLAYISRFVQEVRRLRDQIVSALTALDDLTPAHPALDGQHGLAALVAIAARSRDLPDFDGDSRTRVAWAADQQGKWSGVRAWFLGDGEGPATVDRLSDFARGAVLRLTRTLGRLNDRRGRAVDRTTDFLTLARWFATADTDDDAHVLWHTAFGLSPARHLHLGEQDPETTATRTSWWDADPVAVPTRLRTHGRVQRGGRTGKAADYTDGRRFLAARAKRDRAHTEAALARFVDADLRLSELDQLAGDELALLLGFLDDALAAPRTAGGTRQTRSRDGRLQLALHPPDDGHRHTLSTREGQLNCPDYRLVVREVLRPARVTGRHSATDPSDGSGTEAAS